MYMKISVKTIRLPIAVFMAINAMFPRMAMLFVTMAHAVSNARMDTKRTRVNVSHSRSIAIPPKSVAIMLIISVLLMNARSTNGLSIKRVSRVLAMIMNVAAAQMVKDSVPAERLRLVRMVAGATIHRVLRRKYVTAELARIVAKTSMYMGIRARTIR